MARSYAGQTGARVFKQVTVHRMDVPVSDRTRNAWILHLHGNKACARFNQPACQQRTLTPFVPGRTSRAA